MADCMMGDDERDCTSEHYLLIFSYVNTCHIHYDSRVVECCMRSARSSSVL